VTRVAEDLAYILHQHEYGESSLLLEVLCRQSGRIGLLAKGARRPRSPLRATLLPFQPLVIAFSGRGELPVLGQAEPARSVATPSGQNLYCAIYLNELMMRLLHRHDPHERLFDSYATTLDHLSVGTSSNEISLRIFEKQLLNEIGYGLVLSHDVDRGNPIDPDSTYLYVPEQGPYYRPDPNSRGIEVSGNVLIALCNESFPDTGTLRDAKRLLRHLLGSQLGDRPLGSRKLFRTNRLEPAVE